MKFMAHKLAREEFKNLDKNRDWKPCFWQKMNPSLNFCLA